MANTNDLHRVVGGHIPLRQITSTIPAAYVAGNRFTVAHGLTDFQGNAVTPDIAFAVATATDADAAITVVHYQVVKMDSTNVTLRSDGAATDPFTLYVA